MKTYISFDNGIEDYSAIIYFKVVNGVYEIIKIKHCGVLR